MPKSQVKIKKKNFTLAIATIVAVIIIVVLSIFLIPKSPEKQEIDIKNPDPLAPTQAEIQVYKKALFESIVCQYSCPLVDREVQNLTVPLPAIECVNTCTAELNSKDFNHESFKSDVLLTDDLVPDVGKIFDDCSLENQNIEDIPTKTKFTFNCISENILSLKQNYQYLN